MDKLESYVRLRLHKEDKQIVGEDSSQLGISMSAYIRFLIDLAHENLTLLLSIKTMGIKWQCKRKYCSGRLIKFPNEYLCLLCGQYYDKNGNLWQPQYLNPEN